MDDARFERLRLRLTPEMIEAIRSARVEGRLPDAMKAAVAQDSLKAVIDPGSRVQTEGLGPVGSVYALEAIVQFVGRPPLRVLQDRVEIEPLPDFPPGTAEAIRRMEGAVASVGRIEFINHDAAWGGTGWIVDRPTARSALVVTNRHVAIMVARNRADGRAVFMRSASGAAYGAAIDFSEALDDPNGAALTARISGITYLADLAAADVAILKIDAAAFDLPPPLVLSARAVNRGDLVAVIGYPAYDLRNGATEQDRYFQGLYDVKRFAPGRVLQPGGAPLLLSHDCTTLGGNSGSPVVAIENGEVVGLHFSGRYGIANAAVEAATLRRLLDGERPVAVKLGLQDQEGADGQHSLSDLLDREGFDTHFLGDGLATPWPILPTGLAADLAEPTDDPSEPNEIRYTHFGVKYCTARRLPLIAAVNIDGERSVRLKRDPDRWFSDPRIPLESQLTAANYTDPDIDRGHMVRREDPNWAPEGDPVVARRADQDTFHYVNAAPQHKTLNRSKALWQGLENYILDNARVKGFRASVFTGPVLRADDDDESEPLIDGALVPLEYWKLVAARRNDGHLHATAYLLSQGQLIRRLIEKRGRSESVEGFQFGPYRTFQIRIADLAEATGYDLDAYVPSDPLEAARPATEAAEKGEPVVRPLESAHDLWL